MNFMTIGFNFAFRSRSGSDAFNRINKISLRISFYETSIE